MDFKFKGKSWASNLYHRFESICQDVDDFMNKDTSKFVENQVQTVNFFQSNEVPDIPSLSGDIVTSKAQLVDCEQDGVQNHQTSVTGTAMEPTHVKKLSINQCSVDTMRNSCAALPTEHSHESGLSFDEAKYNQHLSEDNDGPIVNNSDSSFEEKNTKDTMLVTARSSSRNDICCNMSGENHMNSMQTVDPLPVPSACEAGSDEDHRNCTPTMVSSPSVSIHQAETLAIKEDTIICNSFSEETEQTPAVSTSDDAFENKLPNSDGPNFDEEKGLSFPLVNSPNKVHEQVTPDSLLLSSSDAAELSSTPTNKVMEHECVTMDSPVPSIDDVADRSSGTNGVLCESFASNDDVPSSHQSSELVLSFITEEEGEHAKPSTCVTSPESVNILESRSEDIKMGESIHHTQAKSSSCSYDVSTVSEAVTSETKTVAVVLPAHHIPKPEGSSVMPHTQADIHAFWINASDSAVSSSESRHGQQPQIGESKCSISSSDIGNKYEYGDSALDPNMETIDLSSSVKRDEESVVLSSTLTPSASHGRKNFRYYKKLIKDAFTSRKRLSKEYKDLAIMYGDIDKEANQHFQPSSVPSSPNRFILDMVLHSSQEMCDAEWELL